MTQNLNVIKTVSSLGKGYGGGGFIKQTMVKIES